MTLHIVGTGRCAAVFDGKRQLTPMTFLELADRQLVKIKRARESTPRPCLCCNREFLSTGPGNRMCGPCRNASKRAMI
jgi:hypothetical protein